MPKTSPSAAIVIEPYAVKQVAAIEALGPQVMAGDPDAIHDMRVAARRLKSTLVTYKRAFDSDTRRHLRAELDWLTETLGHARDHHVQRLIWRELVDSEDGVADIDAASRAMDAKAHGELQAALTSKRYQALAKELVRFSADPPWTAAAQRPARKVVLKALAKQFKRVDSRVTTAAGTTSSPQLDDRLHRVRKAVKRARYASEAAEPLLGTSATDVARALSTTQDALGAHNDLVATRTNAPTWLELGLGGLDHDALKQLDTRARASRLKALETLDEVRDAAGAGRSLRHAA